MQSTISQGDTCGYFIYEDNILFIYVFYIKYLVFSQQCQDQNHDQAHSWQVLLSRPILKPLGIGLTLLLIQQFSGIDSVIFFTVDIFRASGNSIDDNVATIMVGLLQLGSNIMALFVIDRAGRKPLLIASALLMCLSMASMGSAFYLNSIGYTAFG